MNSNPLNAGNCSGGRIFKSWGIFQDGKRVATMEPDALSPEQEHALAKAFAAAPELLAALNGCVEWMEFTIEQLATNDKGARLNWGGPLSKARTAIAKATGN